MLVFAQLSTSVSDGQIRLIIMALLAVAFLLALLTTWYAIKTSPHKRVRAAQARRAPGPAGDGRAAPGATPGSSATRPAAAQPTAARPTGVADQPRPAEPTTVVDDDDEWTRLTAPQTPQQQRSTHG